MTEGGNTLTMTPEIAASILDGTSKYRPHPTHVEDAKLFAARVLRSVATASADAEKGCHEWTMAHRLDPDVDIADAYLAGHAAATAAKQADLAVMCEEVERLDSWMRFNLLSGESLSSLDNRPARVTKILAARKEKQDAME